MLHEKPLIGQTFLKIGQNNLCNKMSEKHVCISLFYEGTKWKEKHKSLASFGLNSWWMIGQIVLYWACFLWHCCGGISNISGPSQWCLSLKLNGLGKPIHQEEHSHNSDTVNCVMLKCFYQSSSLLWSSLSHLSPSISAFCWNKTM